MAEKVPYREHDPESGGVWRWMKLVTISVAILGLVVVVVRLRSGGDSDGGGGGHQRPDDSGQTYTEEQEAEFAQCMRDQGIDFQIGEDGEMSPPPGVDVNGSEFQEALAVCREQLAPEAG